MDKYLGKRLDGRYEIKELIGVGGMAHVYKAEDIVQTRTVAIKILKDEFLDSPDFLRRFRNESKAIAVLSQPNIVKVYDVSFGDTIQYIIMEYIDGITLKEFIETQEILTWKEAVHFAAQILKGLQHAHDKGIVHRDIKPQNIMLLQDGTIKVMDFGIARFARDDARTMTDKALGSVHYISPEQAKGETADEKSDIYAVGVMLFEMITGKLPFEADNAVSVALMQMQVTPKMPSELNSSIPKGLEEITIRAMQKNAIMRYQSAAEMLRDLDLFRNNPNTTFEYKYYTEDGHTKYFDTVSEPTTVISSINDKNHTYNSDKGSEVKQMKKSKTIPILAGVAVAFVIMMILILIGFNFFGTTAGNEVVMPDLVGKNINDLKNDSTTAKFRIEISSSDYTNEYDKDIIYDQNVRVGQNVKENTVVKVKVSLGKKLVEIPDIYNASLDDSQSQLKALGLTYKLVRVFDDSIANDRVVKTEPARGEQVEYGSEVKIYVSMGKDIANVTVPNVVGKTEAQAKLDLDKVKLKYNISTVDSTQTKGTVVSQSIAANTTVAEGTLIDITISTGKTPSKEMAFSVDLPNNISGSYKFIIYVNGVVKSTQIVNVSTTSKFQFSLQESGTQEVTVNIAGANDNSQELTFIRYSVNFDRNTSQIIFKNNNAFDSFSNNSSSPTSSKPNTSSNS